MSRFMPFGVPKIGGLKLLIRRNCREVELPLTHP